METEVKGIHCVGTVVKGIHSVETTVNTDSS